MISSYYCHSEVKVIMQRGKVCIVSRYRGSMDGGGAAEGCVLVTFC